MIKYKYSENAILNEVQQYIDNTYKQHYVGKNDIQTLDVWEALDQQIPLCQGNAIKYLMRYGKKAGHNKQDLLKAIHYCILLWHYSQQNEDQPISEPQLLVEQKHVPDPPPPPRVTKAEQDEIDNKNRADAEANVNTLISELNKLVATN